MTNKTTPIHTTGVINGNLVSDSNPLPVNIISGGTGSGGGIPATKATDAYAFQATSTTASYVYYFYEDGAANWYILRETIATGVYDYAKGTGGYESVYVNSTSAPSGSPTFDSYEAIFDNTGAGSLSFDSNGYLEVTLSNLEESNVHTGDKELRVFSQGHVCTNNSTNIPLGINGVFTGDWQDTLDYSEVIVSIYTDKNSVTNGLAIYWSADGITIHGDDFFTISASSGKTFSFPCQNRYVKVVYTNDGVAQTYFVLQTLLKRFASKGSSHRLKDQQSQEDDAILTKSAIVGLSSSGGGTVVDVKVNPSGSLQVGGTVDINSSALPTGAATSANQTNGNQIVKAYLTDEFGIQSQMLGDNIFGGSPVIIETEHHEIHCGDALCCSHVVDLTNGATRDILIVTPVSASRNYHMYIEVVTESEADFKLYEDTTTSNNGTTLNARNRNRANPVVSESEVGFYHTPTVTGVGTLIEEEHWGSGKGVGGTSRGQNEWIFKNNAKYMIRVTNSTTQNNHIAIKINYYVHPGV